MEGVKDYPGLKVFRNDLFGEIRVMSISEEPWWIGIDVARALGYKAPSKSVIDRVDTEDRRLFRPDGQVLSEPYQIGNTQCYQNSNIQKPQKATFEIAPAGVTIINESGLYSLILSSKLPKAKAFKRWVTGSVLPAIRKQGFYDPSPKSPLNLNPAPIPVAPAFSQSKREPTFEETLKAAELVMKCGDNRLSYVLAMLRQYGFELPERDS